MVHLNSVQKEAVSRGKLEAAVAAAGHIARPTASPDLGIDGDIEFFTQARATGARLAFQLKTGASYVSSVSASQLAILVESKHLRYWCCVNLPVLLIYYDADADVLYWQDVKHWLLESGFDPTQQSSTVVPVPKANVIQGDCTEQWRRILSLSTAQQHAIQERFRLAMPELGLFRDPRFLPGAFAFTEARHVVAETLNAGSTTLVELPPELAPPLPTTTTLVTIFSHGGQSTGVLFTTLGSPEVPFNTIVNDTVPIEMTVSFGHFYCRVDEGCAPVRLVCKGYGYFTG